MTIIDDALLDSLSAAARENPRLRKNFNLHQSYDDPCQRLLNAVEPGSYIRPHRHLTPPKPESFVVLRGRIALLLFGEKGELDRCLLLGPAGEAAGVDLPPAVWHSILSLERGSVFFETKPGPYEPMSDKDFAPWAPPEGSPEAAGYLAGLVDRVPNPES